MLKSQPIPNSYVSILLILFITLLLTNSCKKDNNNTPDSNIIGTDGGVYKIGNTEIFFPAESVSEKIIIEGSIEDTLTIPEHITLLSDIHKIQISNPDAYEANSATISIVHNDDPEILSIFVSSDGINWTNLKGYKNDQHLVASIPHFSYFFAGNATYTIFITNNSAYSVGVVQYQYDENIYNGLFYPTVMNSGHLETAYKIYFSWKESFMFWWANSGYLEEGKILTPASVAYTDQSTNNQISLNYSGSTYQFSNQIAGPVAGPLTIVQESSIPSGQVSCGIGFGNTPTYAIQATANVSSVFNITNHKYFIAVGSASVGEAVYPNAFISSTSIDFPDGHYNSEANINDDLTFTVNYY